MGGDLLGNFRAAFERSVEAFKRGDLDGAVAGLPEKLEIYPTSEDVESKVHRGPEGMKELFARFYDAFDEWQIDVRDMAPVGDHALLANYRTAGDQPRRRGLGRARGVRALGVRAPAPDPPPAVPDRGGGGAGCA